jgi:hypothetical protein
LAKGPVIVVENHRRREELVMERSATKGQKCMGDICFCDRCLYVFGFALLVFAVSTPAAILSQDFADWTVTVVLATLAAISLAGIAFSCAVNFLGAWRKHHYYTLRHSPRSGDT